MPRKTVYISAGFLSGLFLSFYLDERYTVWLVAAVGTMAAVCIFLRSAVRKRILLAACAALVAILYSCIYSRLIVEPLERLDGERVAIEGTVTESTVSDSSRVIIKGTVNGIPCKVSAYISNFSGDIGDSVSFEATAKSFESGALFDERSYYLPDGIYLSVSPVGEITVVPCERATVVTLLRRYSGFCSDRLRQYVGGDAGDLLCAMATGDRSYLDDSVRLAINRSGLGHIIAVSGLHVSIACAFVLILLRRAGVDKRFAVIPAGMLAIAFVIFSGLKISAIRAAVMMGVYVLATLSRRRADPLNTLSFCALIMAVFNPYVAADSSFILSLSGVYGVSVFAPFVNDALSIKSKLGRSFISASCASVSTAPAMMLYFNELSLAAPFTNFLLLPVCSVALILSLSFVLLGCPQVLSLLPKLAGLIMQAVMFVCEKVSHVRLTYLPLSYGTPTVIAIVASFAVLGAAVIVKNKKAVLACVVAAVCVFMGSYSLQAVASKDTVRLSVVASGGDCALLLRKNSECIIIDISGGASLDYELEKLCERYGISGIRLATANKNGESAYSKYAGMSVAPDQMLLPDGSYIFGGAIPYDYLGEVTKITFADCEITLSLSGAMIEQGDKSISVQNGVAKGGDINISVFDGVLVINGESHTGEVLIEFEL